MPDHSHYRCDVEGQHRALKLVEGMVKRHMGLGYSRRLGMEVSSTKTNACGHIDDEEMGWWVDMFFHSCVHEMAQERPRHCSVKIRCRSG